MRQPEAQRPCASRAGSSLLLVMTLAACAREKESIRDELQPIHTAWYRQAWGRALDAQEAALFDRRYECLWEAVSQAGGNPADDLRCFGRRLETHMRCMQPQQVGNADAVPAECPRTVEATCRLSAAFDAASKTHAVASAAHRMGQHRNTSFGC